LSNPPPNVEATKTDPPGKVSGLVWEQQKENRGQKKRLLFGLGKPKRVGKKKKFPVKKKKTPMENPKNNCFGGKSWGGGGFFLEGGEKRAAQQLFPPPPKSRLMGDKRTRGGVLFFWGFGKKDKQSFFVAALHTVGEDKEKMATEKKKNKENGTNKEQVGFS